MKKNRSLFYLVSLFIIVIACSKETKNIDIDRPIIDSISPLFVSKDQIFKIYGKNFSAIANNNSITINGISVTGAVTGNCISVKLPDGIFPDDTSLVAQLILNVAEFKRPDTTYFYSNLTPRVYSMNPPVVHRGDTITITGNGFVPARDKKRFIFLPPTFGGVGAINPGDIPVYGIVVFMSSNLAKVVIPPKANSGYIGFLSSISVFIPGSSKNLYPITIIP